MIKNVEMLEQGLELTKQQLERAIKDKNEVAVRVISEAIEEIEKEIKKLEADAKQPLLLLQPSAEKATAFRDFMVNPIKEEENVFKKYSEELLKVINKNPHRNMRDAIENFVRTTGSASPREMLNMIFRYGGKNVKPVKHYLDFISAMANGATPVIPIKMLENQYLPPYMGADITEFAMNLNEEGTISPNSSRLRNFFDEMSTREIAIKEIQRTIGRGEIPQMSMEEINSLAICIVPSSRLELIQKYERDGYVEF